MVLAAACDKVPLLAPTQSTVTIQINTTTVPLNGTAEVIASVIEPAGTPVHNGTTVTFTASVGTVEPREARTEGGIARTTFRAGNQSGTAKVGAFSGAARATEVDILVGGAAAAAVAVRVSPSTVPETGDTVTVIAIVTDAAGNRLPGAPVVFSSDNGVLASNTGTTDQNGEARTTIQTNRQTVVRANVAGKEGQATISVVNLPSASITFTPAAPLVGVPVVFTVTPGATTGGNPIRNVTLDFGDGKAPANLGAISSAVPVSHIYDRADTYTVTLRVVDTAGQERVQNISLTVLRPVVVVSVTGPNTGQIGTPVSFTVTVANSNNINLTGVLVNFGDGIGRTTLGPTGGTATYTYTRSGPFTVTATATDLSGNQYTGTHQITIAPTAAFNTTLDAQSGDAAVTLICTPGAVYPKTCTTHFVGAGVRVIFTVGCSTGFGTGACANATSYTFNFGDGTPPETTPNSSVDHVFRSRGEFLITATVTTSTGVGTQRLTLIIQ